MLVLIPTLPEAERILDGPWPRHEAVLETRLEGRSVRAALTGFGPIAAGVLAARALLEARPAHVVLAGLAGTYRAAQLPVGALLLATEVVSGDVGRGRGARRLGSLDLGFPQAPAAAGRSAVGERLALSCPSTWTAPDVVRGQLVTVASASASRAEAERLLRAWPGALAEDMEGFAVALAAQRQGVRCTIVRAISNVAGDADRSCWKVDEPLSRLRHFLGALPVGSDT